MSKSMTQRLVKLLASDVDFQSRLKPSDRIEVFFSQPDSNDEMSAIRTPLRIGDFRRQHAQPLPLPDGRRHVRLFRRGRPQRKAVPAAQPASERQVPLRLRRPPPSDPRLFQDAHRRRLGRAHRLADHRSRQRRRREGRLGRRLWQADDHPSRQRLRNILQPPEPHRQRHKAWRPACARAR